MGFQSCTYNIKAVAEAVGVDVKELFKAMRQNQVGGFLRVWSVGETRETQGKNGDKINICSANVSSSNKASDGTYKTDFKDGYVSFFGKAADKLLGLDIPETGLSIQVTSCAVTNSYSKKTNKLYTNYTVYAFDTVNNQNRSGITGNKSAAKPSQKKAPRPVGDDDDWDLPF